MTFAAFRPFQALRPFGSQIGNAAERARVFVLEMRAPNVSDAPVQDATGVTVHLWAGTDDGLPAVFTNQSISNGNLVVNILGTDFGATVNAGDAIVGKAFWSEGADDRWLYFESSVNGANAVPVRVGGTHQSGGIRMSSTVHSPWT